MMSVGHGALGAPSSLVGGSALGQADARGQHKLKELEAKMAAKKSEDLSKPYVSEAQRRWAHTEHGKEALGGASKVHEWDESTKGKKLPEKVGKTEDAPMPTNEADPKDWETIIGEKLNRFSQLLRSDVVRLKLQKLQDKIK